MCLRVLGACAVMVLIGAGILPGISSAQSPSSSPSLHFRNLTTADGLPQQDVGVILQDSVGFLWFGTEDGLVRYDGSELRVFRPVPFDSTSLSSSWIVGLSADADGSMWIATEGGGLNQYFPQYESFKRHPHGDTVSAATLWTLHQSVDGALWLGARDDNLSRFDLETGESTWYRYNPRDPDDPRGLADQQINAIAEDGNGRIWVGTESGGVDRIDPSTGIVEHYGRRAGQRSRRSADAGLPDERVLAITVGADESVWVGTARGLARYDAASDAFEGVTVGSLARPRVISAIFEDPDEILWIGTDNGLVRYDRAAGTTTDYRNDPSDASSLGAGTVHAIFLDRTGVMWVGTRSGVSAFLWAGPRFEKVVHNPSNPNTLGDPGVWSFLEDSDGYLWVGTESGLDRFDQASGEVTHFAHVSGDPSTLTPGWVVSLFEDSQGTFWVGTRRDGAYTGTLNRFDRASGRVAERFQQDLSDSTSLWSDNPWQLFEDSDNRLWVLSGGTGCINLMNRSEGTFKSYCHDPDNPNSPTYDAAKKMAESPKGVLWFATWSGGLNRLDTRSDTWSSYRHDPANRNSPADDYLLSMHAGPDGNLWLGTYGAGLDRFDPATGVFTHFTTANSGLPNDVVYAIEGDDEGHIWLSTNNGLARYDAATDRFRSFGLEHGLQDLEFNAISSYRAADGELFFGGINGFNRFDPGDIADDAPPARVVLTDLWVRGQPVPPTSADDDSPLDRALPFTQSISLGARQHDFAVTFASLDFTDPTRTRFRYRLDGYDDDWQEVGGERRASYTNLDAGSYSFVVQATNSTGQWGEPGTRLAVRVRPHWSRTWWAYFVYGLVLVGGLVLVAANYRSRVLMRHRLDLEKVEAEKLRELDRTRSHFFANVSHEFRTPLTLTIGPLDDLRSGLYGEMSPDMNEQVDLARRNAGRVLDLINQILEVARLEAGRTPLRAHRMDLSSFLRDVVGAFLPLADRKDQSFEVIIPSVMDDVYADPQLLEKIIANLLSNAIKFTPVSGEVALMAEVVDDSVVIRVRDSGPGIPPDELPYIFDRFYRSSESTTWKELGTGIGLSLARELAELHKGVLSVESEVGVGTVFVLTLRRGRGHLSADQVVSDGEMTAVPRGVGKSVGTDVGKSVAKSVGTKVTADGDDVTTVLVVDDNAEIRSYVRRHLEGRYRVLEAEDGVAGLATVAEALPDLIVSDVMMPEMDGFAFCRALKSDPETDFIPVVLLTAKAEHEDKLEGLHERADDYMTKPFQVDELLARVKNLIDSRRRLKARFATRENAPPGEIRLGAADLPSVDTVFRERVAQIVEAHIDDENFTVEQFADEVGLDRSQLYRRLQDLVSLSPTDLIMNARLERAAELLAANAGNVSEVAYAVGFKSVAHFSRRFRKQFEATPTAYRASQSVAESTEHSAEESTE